MHLGAGGEVVRVNNGAFAAIEKRVNATVPLISGETALASALARTMPTARMPQFVSVGDDGRKLVFDGSALGNQPVVVQLVYQPVGERLHLAWNVNHYTPDGSHWWNIRIDAIGAVSYTHLDVYKRQALICAAAFCCACVNLNGNLANNCPTSLLDDLSTGCLLYTSSSRSITRVGNYRRL